jgi:uncharacterized protein
LDSDAQRVEYDMAWTHGHFYWNEFLTRDTERAKKFYGALLGWTFDPMPMPQGGTYWVAKQDRTPVAGLYVMADMPPQVPEHWFPYIGVDDVDARVKKAVASGARLMKPVFDVPGVGRIAILTVANGAGIGLMTPAD